MALTSCSSRSSRPGGEYVSLDDVAHGAAPEGYMAASSQFPQHGWVQQLLPGEYGGSSSFDDEAPESLTALSAVSPPDKQHNSDNAFTEAEFEMELNARLEHYLTTGSDEMEQPTSALALGDANNSSEGHLSDTLSDIFGAGNEHTVSVQSAASLPVDDAPSASVDDASSVSGDDASSVAGDDASSVAGDDASSVAGDDASSPPVVDAASIPVDDAVSLSFNDHISACEEYLASNNGTYSDSFLTSNYQTTNDYPTSNYQPIDQFNPFEFTGEQDFGNAPVYPANVGTESTFHHGNEYQAFNANDYGLDLRNNPDNSFIPPQSGPAVQSSGYMNPTNMNQYTNAGLNGGYGHTNPTSMNQYTNDGLNQSYGYTNPTNMNMNQYNNAGLNQGYGYTNTTNMNQYTNAGLNESYGYTNPTSMNQYTNAGFSGGLFLGNNQGNFSDVNAPSMNQGNFSNINATSMNQYTNAGLNEGFVLGSDQGNINDVNATSMYQPINAAYNDGLNINLSPNPETPSPSSVSPFMLPFTNFTSPREATTVNGLQSNMSLMTDTIAGTTEAPVTPARRIAKPRKTSPVPKKASTPKKTTPKKAATPKKTAIAPKETNTVVRPYNEIQHFQLSELTHEERMSLVDMAGLGHTIPAAPPAPKTPKAPKRRAATDPDPWTCPLPTPKRSRLDDPPPFSTEIPIPVAPLAVQQKRLTELVEAFVKDEAAQTDFRSKVPNMGVHLHILKKSKGQQASMVRDTLNNPYFQRAFSLRIHAEAKANAMSYGALRQLEAIDKAEDAAMKGRRRR